MATPRMQKFFNSRRAMFNSQTEMKMNANTVVKVDIPQTIQGLFKCDECDEFLSCGPVFVIHETGETVCGRCRQEPESKKSTTKTFAKTRNNKYEAAAKLLRFPCTYAKQGCTEKMDFSENEPNIHELNCEFRSFICPMVPRGQCDWVGTWKNLEAHCKDKHSSQVYNNPCNPPNPNLTVSSLSTYLISAFNFLFLLHVQVCVASGKLFHSVRMFGDSKYLNNFSFNSTIEGNHINISKFGSVLPAGLLTIQEPTAICTKINGLLEILDGKYNEVRFIYNILSSMKECLNCPKEIKHDSNSNFCIECNSKLIKCKLHAQGCLFADFEIEKCRKHENYFCRFQKICNRCQRSFVGSTPIEHMKSGCSQNTISSNINSVVRLSNQNGLILLSSNNIDIIFCEYKTSYNNYNKLDFSILTSIPSYELKKYKCTLKLTDHVSKITQEFLPEISQKTNWDWKFCVDLNMFSSWHSQGYLVDFGYSSYNSYSSGGIDMNLDICSV